LSPEDNSLVHVFDELIASILKVFPDVLRASRPANPDLVVVDPPAFSSPKSAKEWGKDGANKGFHEMDQAAAFEAKYLGDSCSVSAKIKLSKIAALLEDIDSRDLLDSLLQRQGHRELDGRHDGASPGWTSRWQWRHGESRVRRMRRERRACTT
jgi:hypothetical protein